MKKYEMPELELKVFALEDVIAASSDLNACPQDGCPNATEWD